jgi:hypothetical protein
VLGDCNSNRGAPLIGLFLTTTKLTVFNNTRTHLKHSIDDLNSGNTQGAISELKIVDKSLGGHEQGMLMMVGRILSSSVT